METGTRRRFRKKELSKSIHSVKKPELLESSGFFTRDDF